MSDNFKTYQIECSRVLINGIIPFDENKKSKVYKNLI